MNTPRNREAENEKKRALRRHEDWGTNYLITTNKGGVKITKAKTPPGKYEPRDSFMGQITGVWRTVK